MKQTAAGFANRYVRAYKAADLSTAHAIRPQAERKLSDESMERFYDIINEPKNMEIDPAQAKLTRALRNPIPSQWTPVSITRKGKQIQIHTRGR